MTKKKRNKKFNAVESARITNMAKLKNVAVAFVTNDMRLEEPVKLVKINGDELPVTNATYKALTDFRYKWSIYLIVGCFNSKGDDEIKIDYAFMTELYFQSELVHYLNERHQIFINDLRSKNVNISFAGWVARPTGREINPEELYEIFRKQKAWG